jgi:hypothetical protein
MRDRRSLGRGSRWPCLSKIGDPRFPTYQARLIQPRLHNLPGQSAVLVAVCDSGEFEAASIGQIRSLLPKNATRLEASARRVHIELCSAYPPEGLFALVHRPIG